MLWAEAVRAVVRGAVRVRMMSFVGVEVMMQVPGEAAVALVRLRSGFPS
jgi:hypothetical protein